MVGSKKIVVMLPALNEAQNILGVLEKIPSFIDRVIVIDDGSTDNTVELLKDTRAEVISHTATRGLGYAFQTGIEKAMEQKFDVLVNMDSDGQFNPKDIEKLINPIIENKADFVSASRFKDPSLYPKMSRIKFWGNKRMAKLISSLTQQKFYDVSCGFRAYSIDTILRMNLFGKYTYTQESFLDLAFKNIRILEVPVEVRGVREFGKSRIASNLFRYTYRTSNIILRTFRDYKPLRLFMFLGSLSFLIGFFFWVYLLVHYIKVGVFTPYKWVGFTGAFFVGASILFAGLGFILDMFARMRINQERILYEMKKSEYFHSKSENVG